MSFETVLYEVKENIARITMNRPEKRNALACFKRGVAYHYFHKASRSKSPLMKPSPYVRCVSISP